MEEEETPKGWAVRSKQTSEEISTDEGSTICKTVVREELKIILKFMEVGGNAQLGPIVVSSEL